MLRDRGTIKWTSLMLPEHVTLLKEMWQEDTKVKKPEIDEQEMEIMNRRLSHAHHHNETVQLSIYHDGEITTLTGNIKEINIYNKTIRLQNGRRTKKVISFYNITDVHELDE